MTEKDKSKLDLLAPKARDAAYKAIATLDAINFKYFISETRRPLLTQLLYWCQGRADIKELEWACKEAGIRAPGPQQITWTLHSNHYEGNAIDVLPLDQNGNVEWNRQDQKIVEAFTSEGFDWGGYWKQADMPHFEIK